MITEERLRSLLEEAAAAAEPPAGGPGRIVGAASSVPTRTRLRPDRLRASPPRLVAAVTLVVVVVAAGLAWRDRDGGDARSTDEVARADSPRSVSDGGQGVVSGGTTATTLARLQPNAFAAQPSPSAPGVSAAAPAAGPAPRPGPSPGAAGAAAPQGPPGPQAQGVAGSDLAKIVKTGSLELAVARGRVGEVVAAIVRVTTAAGGYVADSSTAEASGRPSGAVTVRVPAERFESVTGELRGLGRVRQASSGGRDAAGEYADVEARLRTLATTRESLSRVLSEARSVGDILAVQSSLTPVQSEIEQLQARQRALEDQIALGTISVTVVERGATAVHPQPASPSAWERAVDGFTGTWSSLLAHSGTALALVIMGAALLAALVAVVRWGRRAYARWAA